MINELDHIPRTTVRVLGHGISVAEAGSGPSLVLLHGNATYSYAWRNVIAFLAQRFHCFAPDLPGMGNSEPILPSGASSYPLEEQTGTIELLLELMELPGPLILVGHELGAAIAIQLGRRLGSEVAGLVLVEGVFRVTNDSTFDADVAEMLAQLRGENGEELVLGENRIIEQYLPRLTARILGPEEMRQYREPYRRPGESRRAMLSMIRQLPLRGSPGPIDDLVEQMRLWCAQSRIPKLVIGGNPGFLTPPSILGTAARWAETTVASIRGIHFLMEDSPARLTTTILDWLLSLDRQS